MEGYQVEIIIAGLTISVGFAGTLIGVYNKLTNRITNMESAIANLEKADARHELQLNTVNTFASAQAEMQTDLKHIGRDIDELKKYMMGELQSRPGNGPRKRA